MGNGEMLFDPGNTNLAGEIARDYTTKALKIAGGVVAIGAVLTAVGTPAVLANGGDTPETLEASQTFALLCLKYEKAATMEVPIVDILNGLCKTGTVMVYGAEQADAQWQAWQSSP